MSNFTHKLYSFTTKIDLVATETQIILDNRPMNSRKIKVHKGVNNEILFSITNKDRKKTNVFADNLYAYIVNPLTKQRLVSKLIEHTSESGVISLLLTDGDLQNVNKGLYHMHIVKNDGDNQTYLPLYSDQQGNAKIELEVTDQIVQEPIATQEDTTFLQTADTDTGDAANTYVSNAMYGNLNKNFQNAQHTVAVYPASAYTGQVTVQASLLSSVPDSDDISIDWFDVKNIDMTANTQIRTETFSVSANWVRIVSKPTTSDTTANLTKVLLRN
tara:strand:+ start:392 stop:1210 length:819 start_codon:yes stop_codon:yes gene_type:complete